MAISRALLTEGRCAAALVALIADGRDDSFLELINDLDEAELSILALVAMHWFVGELVRSYELKHGGRRDDATDAVAANAHCLWLLLGMWLDELDRV